MSRIMKWVVTIVAVVSLAIIFTPAIWAVEHGQSLTNVLLGQFAAIATSHTAYRIASGKRPAVRTALIAIVCGAALAVSPIYFELVTGFTSVNMIGGLLIAAVGVYGIASRVMGDEEEQRLPEMTAEQSPDEQAKAA